MERIKITSDSPGYIKVFEIGEELIAFSEILEKKYNQIDFDLGFCFRVLPVAVDVLHPLLLIIR